MIELSLRPHDLGSTPQLLKHPFALGLKTTLASLVIGMLDAVASKGVQTEQEYTSLGVLDGGCRHWAGSGN